MDESPEMGIRSADSQMEPQTCRSESLDTGLRNLLSENHPRSNLQDTQDI